MGRPKGAKNKVGKDAKAAIAAFVEGKARKAMSLWDAVADSNDTKDKARAIALWAELAEFVAPKLGRTELTGKDGSAVVVDFGMDLSRKP